MQIAIATNNTHKISELKEILPEYNLLTPKELGVCLQVEETGNYFWENALLKAHAFKKILETIQTPYNLASIPVLADDSGLAVNELEGRPGIHSARYGIEQGIQSDKERLVLLLEEMKNISNRQAEYVCAIALLVSKTQLYLTQQTWKGRIALHAEEGNTGFGYDPAFIPHAYHQPVSQMQQEEKHRHSHRGKAVRAVMKMLHTG